MTYHFEKYGTGIPLVMLHGFTGSTQNWHPYIQPLGKKYQLLLIDLPGHGKTSVPDDLTNYTMPVVAQQVTTLIQQQAATPIHLLGYSMGGRLALYIAVHYPHLITHLFLESSSPGLDAGAEQRQHQDNQLADQIEARGMAWFVEYWENIPLFETQKNLPQTQREKLRQQRYQNSPTGLANSLRGMGTGVQPSLWGELGELKMPVVLMVGDRDSKFVMIARQMHQRIPNSILHIITNAGHIVHLEQPEKFEQILKAESLR